MSYLISVLRKTLCMGKKAGFYAVRRGRCPGVYLTWLECESQVKGFANARYKKFSTEKEALVFIQDTSDKNGNGVVKQISQTIESINLNDAQLFQSDLSSFIKSTSCIEKEIKLPAQQKKRKLEDVLAEEEDATSSKSVTVYTDGACSFNGAAGAKAGIGVYWGPNHPLNVSERLPGRQTNNRAEIHAAICALEQAKKIGANNVTLYTDSNFLVKATTEWIFSWKKNGWKLSTGETVKNKDDFQELENAKKGLNINWVHVRGHQGIQGNEEADRLAVAALDKPL